MGRSRDGIVRRMADRRADKSTYNRLKAIRDERFALMEELSKLPSDMNFFTQITMEAAEDPEYLDAMAKARIRGALVGIESVTPEGLKDVYKDFNLAGDALAERLQEFKKRGVHVLGSFIFGLPSDNAATFDATAALAPANAAPSSFMAAFTRRCSRRSPSSTAGRTPWPRVTAIASGRRSSTTARRARCNASTTAARSRAARC